MKKLVLCLLFIRLGPVEAGDCKIALITDGYYDSGSQLPIAARRLGLVPIALRSSEIIPSGAEASFDSSPYEGSVVIHRGNFQETFDQIAAQIAAVGKAHSSLEPKVYASPTGVDRGIVLADQVARHYEIPGNNPDTSPQRYDKAEIGEVLAAAGIKVPAEIIADNPGTALEWAVNRNQWPYFVKPTRSNGSDSNGIADDRYKLLRLLDPLGKPNQQGLINTRMAIQEYKRGKQFAANGITYRILVQGQPVVVRLITDFWFQDRDENVAADFPPFVYDTNILLPYHGRAQNLILPVNERLMTAQQHEVGFFHNEFKITPEGEVFSIDPNARGAGGRMVEMAGKATGRDIFRMGLNTQVNPESLTKLTAGYDLKNQVVITYIRSYGNARLSPEKVNQLARMKSELLSKSIHMEFNFYHSPDEVLNRTWDADSMLGKIVLKGELDSLDVLKRISKGFRLAEHRREFEIPIR
jgi:hypothetical protein